MTASRQSTPEDIKALFEVCQRLGGFDSHVSFEWLDGAMTAIVCGPRLPPYDEWTEALLGDALPRAFSDPDDAQAARHAIEARWNVLVAQLYSEQLADEPDVLRLLPQLHDYSGVEAPAEEIPLPGELWAEGFGDAVEVFRHDWVEPDLDSELGDFFAGCLDRVSALMLDEPELQEHLAEYYAGQTLTRDDLIDEACFAVQDLRVYWSDTLPPPAPRHVEKTPGRNDPCPCGSGKKFKKCHGA